MSLAITGCQTTTSDEDIVPIDYSRVHALREADREALVLLDVRSPEAFARGHIPGAVNIPLPDIQRRDARLAETDRIIVFGIDGQSGLASAATKKLISLGYRNVYEFRGGLATWRAEGGEFIEPADPNTP